MEKRVLFLAVPIGAGHVSAAHAVDKALNLFDPSITTRFENAFDWALPEYGWAYRLFYEFSVRNFQNVLRTAYESPFIRKSRIDLLPYGHRTLLHHFPRLIKEFKPHMIVSTHFSPTYFSILLKRDYGFKLTVVITDYHVHPYWYNPSVDYYVVAHEDLAPQLEAFGVRAEQIFPLGIPIDPNFDQPARKDTLRRKLKLPSDRPLVLVMGGKIFGGPWFDLVKILACLDISLVVLCGRNKAMKKKISTVKGRARITTYGVMNNAWEFIRASDYLITKAGGITTTEAMVCGINLIIANSIPGLESYNEEFFVSRLAAVNINAGNACQVLTKLINDRVLSQTLRKNLTALAKPKPAFNIAKRIKSLVKA